MLVNLNIVDLAVVKTLDLELHQGMSVLTGETGAGKSILLTALGLALGDRADSGYVRPEAKRAEINLEFDLHDSPLAKLWLQENELEDGDYCLIRRIVTDDGRSKAYVNSRPVTLQILQDLSEKLVQIHGQHAHLTLLHSEEQRRLVDSFGKNQALVEQLNDCYHAWHKAQKELDKLNKSAAEQIQREEYLRYQIDELRQIDLEKFDYQSLSHEHHKLANLENILTIGQRQLDALYENDHLSVNQMLNHSIGEMNQIAVYAPELNEIVVLLNDAQIQVEEASQQLRRFLKSLEAEPQRLADLENQLALIQKLSRKHHVAPDKLPELAVTLESELDGIMHSGERVEELKSQTNQFFERYNELARSLSSQRRQQARQLQEQISAMIKELGMPNGEFLVDCIEIPDSPPKLNGKDKIEFLVCPNPGLPAKPLAKVASGGELSRISLAIQVTTSNDNTTPTMVFDEVDSGIGGGTAEIVGQKLHRLSSGRQVICVTHLPQVAAQADTHIFVEKNHGADITTSSVRLLDTEERVEEIARMLGGVTITDNTRRHAREMLDSGRL